MTSFERDLEGQAERVARRVPDRGGDQRSGDGRVSADLRSPVEQALGVDLADVRVRTGRGVGDRVESLGGDALATGDEIHFAPGRYQPWHPGGRELLRHELVHVAQQRTAGAGGRGTALPARRGALQLGLCSSDSHKAVIKKLKAGTAIDHDEATGVMKAYDDMGSGDRDSTIADLYSYQASPPPLQNLLQALTEEERVSTWAEVIQDMLRRVQARATEAASGATFDAMAKTQGAHMESEARAKALAEAQEAAKKSGRPPPASVSDAEVRKTHEDTVKKESRHTPQPDEWAALGADGQKKWWPEAKAARKSIIDLATKQVPAMKLKESDIALEPDVIAKESQARGMRIFALSGRPMTVGLLFVEAAKANPAYVLGAVLHEIYGHPMHGAEAESYAWKLYKASTSHFPSYAAPADKRPEMNLYGYPETEIYAEMVEASHSTPISAADQAKGIKGSDDPATDIKEMVGRLARNLEPSVAKAVLLGMWERFRIDPRLSPASLQFYKDAVNAQPGLKGAIP